jgi:hypothetical protein
VQMLAPAPQRRPLEQAVQTIAPAALYVPELQYRQVLAPTAPYAPAGHVDDVQTLAPGVLRVPGVQGVHALGPIISLYEPALHGGQPVTPSLVNPAAHCWAVTVVIPSNKSTRIWYSGRISIDDRWVCL